MITFKLKYQLVTYFLKNWELPHSPKANDRMDHRVAVTSVGFPTFSWADSDRTESRTSHRSIRSAKSSSAEEVPARSGRPRQTGPTLKGRGRHLSVPMSALTSAEQAGIPSLVSIYHRGDSQECISEKPKNETHRWLSRFQFTRQSPGRPSRPPALKLESENTATAPYKAVFRIQSEGAL